MADNANNQNGAAKNDKEKPDLSLIPRTFLEHVSRAFMVGETKYGRYNYCRGHKASQLVAAAQRHISAWNEGEELDPDGQHHLGAAGANLAMILRQMELETLKDDRYVKSKQLQGLTGYQSAVMTCPECKNNVFIIPCPYCAKEQK